MEKTKQTKRLLVAVAVYAAIFLAILFISNLGTLNTWLSKILRLFRPVLIGLVLAYLCNPFFRFYERKLIYKVRPVGLRRTLSLIFTYLTLAMIFVILLLLIVPQLVDSIMDFVHQYEDYLHRTVAEVNALVDWANGVLPKKNDGMGLIPPLRVENIQKTLSELTAALIPDGEEVKKLFDLETIKDLFTVAGDVLTTVTDTVLGLFISLYLLNSKEKRYAQIMRMRRALFDDRINELITRVCSTADRSFGGFLRGKILDSAIVGVLVYLLISIIGIKHAILIAVIIAITDIVPIIGPFVGLIPTSIIIFLSDPSKLIPFLLCILLVQQIDGNIIAPKILGENTGVSSLCVMVAITTMGTLWGLAGMVLGVPLFATVLELTGQYLDKRLTEKGLPLNTDSYYGTVSRSAASNGAPDATLEKKQKKAPWKQSGINCGEGDLTAFERYCIDTYALAQKHALFDKRADALPQEFAEEEAELTAAAEEEIAAEQAPDAEANALTEEAQQVSDPTPKTDEPEQQI